MTNLKNLKPTAMGTVAKTASKAGLTRLTHGSCAQGPYDLFWGCACIVIDPPDDRTGPGL